MPYKDIEKRRECNRKYYKNNYEKIKAKKKEREQESKEYFQKRYQENREQILINTKRYKEEHKDIIKEKNKKYYLDNKSKISEQTRKYAKNRYKTDTTYKLNSDTSASIRHSLRSRRMSKRGRHWENMVGYTVIELKEHIESLFKPGMSWSNRSDWHIDHIIPKSFFQFKSTNDVEFKYCWSLNNLQPLWAEDNLSKSNKIIL